MDINKYINYLKEFGLSEIEARLYIGLLETGPSTILDLTRYTGIKRSTAHLNIESLINKGIVTQTTEGVKRKVVAELPENLEFILEKRKRDIQRIESQLPEFVKGMKENIISNEGASKVEIKYFKGKMGVRLIYKDVLKAKELRSYVNINQIFKVFPENPQLFPKAANLGSFKVWKEIIEDSSEARNYILTMPYKKYMYKFFPKEWDIRLFDYMIYENKVAMVTEKNKQISGILITDESVHEKAKILFEMMWGLLPNPNQKAIKD